jgi:hypothetical protein
MDSADEGKSNEFELKRIETVGKFIEAATERQFKLASFGLAGNVGAVAASAIAIKDYKPKLEDKNHDFSDAMFWFLTGAVLSTISLGFVLIASEVFSYIVGFTVANGPTKQQADEEIFSKLLQRNYQGIGLLIFVTLYGFSAWCFFYGVYRVLALLR